MSAADRMVVRTPAGYRSVPRRVGLGMISAGRARLATAEDAAAPLTAAVDVEAPVVPATPDSAPTPQERVVTPKHAAAPAVLEHVSDTPDPDVPTVQAVELPPEPKPTARRGEWANYADSLGVTVTGTMTKREIQEAAEEAATSLANLPQPARTGGRLETPEDEPVTDGSVTDDEDPRTR